MNKAVSFELLELLPASEKKRVLKTLKIQKYDIGETIYERGENCTDAFFVLEGKVKQCNFGPDGDATLFFYKKEGDFFGYYSAITERPQTSTTIAVEKTTIGRMNSADFMSMVLGHKELSSYMLKLVTGTLRSETDRITHLLVMDTSMRVIAAILDYIGEAGSSVINIPARTELASRLGMTRETLARHLSDISKKGLIKVDKDKIHVLDPEQLADLIS